MSTSRMDTCFNQREYKRLVTRYTERIKANVGESKKPTGIERIVNSRAAVNATEIGNFPDAMGRDFFTGWLRSASTSAMSLNKYTALEIKQNKKNPSSVRKNGSGLNNCLSKIKAKQT